MNNKKIIIAGGTGFMGEEMIRYFGKENQLVILTRNTAAAINNRNKYSSLSKEDLKHTNFVEWDGINIGPWVKELEAADILINLSGKSVNCRYTETNKKAIFDSRLLPTTALGTAITQLTHPPKLWINASSATIYRHATDKPQDEYTGEIENDFSVQVCKRWEQTFYEQHTPLTRKVALRMAITLGSGGVLIPYFKLLKYGLGGHQGSGKQMYSWIHVKDTCRMIDWFFEHEELEGTFNCSAPNPVSNYEFMKTLRKITETTFGFPAYKWMIRLGTVIIGSEAELVLKSRWVVPTKIKETGFQFKYPHLEEALKDIVKHIPPKQYKLF
ncbi:MAG: TIGR01777 family protein [Lacibacter sp.]|jgi:uncharacterized protein (TIGR01777 family)